MHRPISKSATATQAVITTQLGTEQRRLSHALPIQTCEHLAYTDEGTTPFEFQGRISSYNINTFKGRVYIPEMGRPISFELGEAARDIKSVIAITDSLAANAQDHSEDGDADIKFSAFEFRSRAGQLKSLLIVSVESVSL
jgi:hypothetical protein